MIATQNMQQSQFFLLSGGSFILSQLDVIKAVHFHKADKNRERNYLLGFVFKIYFCLMQ